MIGYLKKYDSWVEIIQTYEKHKQWLTIIHNSALILFPYNIGFLGRILRENVFALVLWSLTALTLNHLVIVMSELFHHCNYFTRFLVWQHTKSITTAIVWHIDHWLGVGGSYHKKINNPFSVTMFLTHFFPFCAIALGPKLTEKRLDCFIRALKICRSLCAGFEMKPQRFQELLLFH